MGHAEHSDCLYNKCSRTSGAAYTNISLAFQLLSPSLPGKLTVNHKEVMDKYFSFLYLWYGNKNVLNTVFFMLDMLALKQNCWIVS